MILWLFQTTWITSCEECNDCEILMDDPYVLINFNTYSSKKEVNVTVQSVNGINYEQLSPQLIDTARTFRLPLAAGATQSELVINYLELSDVIEGDLAFTDTIVFEYDTTFIVNDNQYKMRIQDLQLIRHTFDSVAPQTLDPTKSSNETTVKVYF